MIEAARRVHVKIEDKTSKSLIVDLLNHPDLKAGLTNKKYPVIDKTRVMKSYNQLTKMSAILK